MQRFYSGSVSVLAKELRVSLPLDIVDVAFQGFADLLALFKGNCF
jgi:hypothetical protein